MQMNNDQFLGFSDLNDIPKNYGVTFLLRNGEEKSFDAVSHRYLHDLRCFEVLSKEDEARLIPMDVIAEIVFDKNWMKIVEMKNEASKTKSNQSGKA